MRAAILGISIIALLALGTSQANAMVTKGTWILQGTVSFSSSSGDLYGDESLTIISLSPKIHYAIIDKFALGGVLDVNMYDQGDFSRTSFFIGPSARYYFGGPRATHTQSVNPYLGAAILLRTESVSDDNPFTEEESMSGSAIQLAGGLAWYVRESTAITPELSINLESLEGETGTTIMVGAGITGFLD